MLVCQLCEVADQESMKPKLMLAGWHLSCRCAGARPWTGNCGADRADPARSTSQTAGVDCASARGRTGGATDRRRDKHEKLAARRWRSRAGRREPKIGGINAQVLAGDAQEPQWRVECSSRLQEGTSIGRLEDCRLLPVGQSSTGSRNQPNA